MSQTARKVVSSTENRYPPMPMQNGRFYVVMLAGGPADIAREVRDKLAKNRNIYVKYHLNYEKDKEWNRPVPHDVDFIIGLKDMMGHDKFDKLKTMAEQAKVRYILTQRKMATMLNALKNYGIHKAASMPVEVTSTAYLREPPEPAEEVAPAPEPVTIQPVEPTFHAPPPGVHVYVSPVPGQEVIHRPGTPSPETAILIAALFQKVKDDHINVMVTPTGFTVEPAK